jgi:hypothetical protein
MNPNKRSPWWKRCVRWTGIGIVWLVIAALSAWAVLALYFDLSPARLHILIPLLYVLAIVILGYFAKRPLRIVGLCVPGFLTVLICWLSLKPSNNRNWQPDDAETPWAEISGDQVTIHNFRDCTYKTESDYRCEWRRKTVSLAQIRGLDLFVTYWGSPWIAHPILSFQFGDDEHVAASIETRDEANEGYSAIRGFFRQYELLYIFSDERDLVRLRTNYRKGEEVYLFHTTAGPEWSRQLFLQYLRKANELHENPQWYNAMTDNCTTNIFTQMAATGQLPAGSSLHDWWILLNGRGPEILYRHGNLAGELPFPELMDRAHINPVARESGNSPDFSRKIRVNRPGFATGDGTTGDARAPAK